VRGPLPAHGASAQSAQSAKSASGFCSTLLAYGARGHSQLRPVPSAA